MNKIFSLNNFLIFGSKIIIKVVKYINNSIGARYKHAFLYFRYLLKKLLYRNNPLKIFPHNYGLNKCAIFYINLSYRHDRKFSIENQFSAIGVKNFQRVDAVFDNEGALGCSLSHLKTLRLAATQNNELIMVCEDDSEFLLSRDDIDNIIQEFYDNPILDMLCLEYYVQDIPVRISGNLSLSQNIQNMG